jgi:hypothetical protein
MVYHLAVSKGRLNNQCVTISVFFQIFRGYDYNVNRLTDTDEVPINRCANLRR